MAAPLSKNDSLAVGTAGATPIRFVKSACKSHVKKMRPKKVLMYNIVCIKICCCVQRLLLTSARHSIMRLVRLIRGDFAPQTSSGTSSCGPFGSGDGRWQAAIPRGFGRSPSWSFRTGDPEDRMATTNSAGETDWCCLGYQGIPSHRSRSSFLRGM